MDANQVKDITLIATRTQYSRPIVESAYKTLLECGVKDPGLVILRSAKADARFGPTSLTNLSAVLQIADSHRRAKAMGELQARRYTQRIEKALESRPKPHNRQQRRRKAALENKKKNS